MDKKQQQWLGKPTWIGLVVLAWDLGVCSSSRSQARFSLVPIWRG